jgi:hypothetical protein
LSYLQVYCDAVAGDPGLVVDLMTAVAGRTDKP